MAGEENGEKAEHLYRLPLFFAVFWAGILLFTVKDTGHSEENPDYYVLETKIEKFHDLPDGGPEISFAGVKGWKESINIQAVNERSSLYETCQTFLLQ